jgi:hypothetical protein
LIRCQRSLVEAPPYCRFWVGDQFVTTVKGEAVPAIRVVTKKRWPAS